jgi:hypothetical protein
MAGVSSPQVGCDVWEARRALLRDAALAGPGAGISPLDERERSGLWAQLVRTGAIDGALAGGGHAFKYNRTLTGRVTVGVVLGLCLFSGEGYDSVLARMMPSVAVGTGLFASVPTACALSQARVRLGEEPMRRLFEHCAHDAPPSGPGAEAFGLVLTAFDGTCFELPSDPDLIEEFGRPTGGVRPLARVVTLVGCGDRRVKAAAIGSYHTGEQELVDRLTSHLAEGTLNLADRNFFSMDRWLRFSATGAEMVWRVKNGAKSLPARIVRRLPDGSHLVRLRESDGMRTRRRKDCADPHAERLPETLARLVEFDVAVTGADGRKRISHIRVLTTLLNHQTHPAREIARVYSERWEVELAYLRIKKTLRGARTVLRAHRAPLVRQEIWAFLIVYNLLCDLAAAAAALEGIDPDEISFVAVLRLTRTRLAADTPCCNCGHRPSDTSDPHEALNRAIAAYPRNRTGTKRKRTSPRTPKDRKNGHSETATYTITITTSNLLETD